MILDLANIDTPAASERGHEIELEYNGAKTGWFVTVRGDMSPSVEKWERDVGNEFRLKQWEAARAARESGQAVATTPELLTESDRVLGLRNAAVRIGGMRGVVFNGKPLEYSPESAFDLVRRHPPFAVQILATAAELANFTKAQSPA